MELMVNLLMPGIIALTALWGVVKKVDVYDALVTGAGEGLGVAGACNPVSSVSRLGEGASWVESPLETAGVESSSPWAVKAGPPKARAPHKTRESTDVAMRWSL